MLPAASAGAAKLKGPQEAQNMRTALMVQQGRFARWPWLEPERCRLDPQIPGKHNA